MFFSQEDLVFATGATLVFDIEVYPNYFCIGFKEVGTDNYLILDYEDDKPLIRYIFDKFTVVGFNSRSYDLPIITYWLMGNKNTYELSTDIIQNKMYLGKVEEAYGFKTMKANHIDLIEVAPGEHSLKTYAGRMQAPKMQDLPYDPHEALDLDQVEELKLYLRNDLDNTELLYKELYSDIELRTKMSVQYSIDLRSKSDAQVAEAIILNEVKRVLGYYPKKPSISVGTCYKYDFPSFIDFEGQQLKELESIVKKSSFSVSAKGSIELPQPLLNYNIYIGESIYKMGIGGLHSCESCKVHKAEDGYYLYDRDVASYYPSIILNQGLKPEHIGDGFLKVYRSLVERRLLAKKNKDMTTANTLKICVNGSFGKFGSVYSVLYAPKLLIQTTITGQLSLLMLIEAFEVNNIKIVSANTDGVVIKCREDQKELYLQIIAWWEERTNFVTEETEYSAIYSRDVNSYIAVKPDGKVKQKGAFAFVGSKGMRLEKNPSNYVCIDAVIEKILHDTPIESTIRACQDPYRFCAVRSVKGGAILGNEYIGKVIRYYHREHWHEALYYKTSGNRVPDSVGAMPYMNFIGMPTDIDYDWYIQKAEELLQDLCFYGEETRLL